MKTLDSFSERHSLYTRKYRFFIKFIKYCHDYCSVVRLIAPTKSQNEASIMKLAKSKGFL